MCPLRRLIGGTAEAEPLCSCSDHHACVRTRSRSRFFVVFFVQVYYRLGHADRKAIRQSFGPSVLLWASDLSRTAKMEGLKHVFVLSGGRWALVWQDLSHRLNRTGHALRVWLGVRGTRAGERRSLASKLNKLRKRNKQFKAQINTAKWKYSCQMNTSS